MNSTSADFRHGGALDRVQQEFPNAPLPWVDLSTGINPLAYPDISLAATAFTHLPTRRAFEACREAMAVSFDAKAEAVLPVAGSEIVIRLLPTLLRGSHVVVLSPSYADHALAWRRAGRCVTQTADPLQASAHADIVVVCQPNNPDGRCFSVQSLLQLRSCLCVRGGWLIVDEAYADLDPAVSLAGAAGSDGLIILRSSGKFFGLAGLRLGAVLAPPDLLSQLQASLGHWNVSGPALEIGSRMHADLAWQAATRKRLCRDARQLDGILERIGLTILGGTHLFRFVEVPGKSGKAHALWREIAAAGIYVRRFDWTERHLRIGLPKDDGERMRLAKLSLLTNH